MADRSGSNIAFLDKSLSKEKCRSCLLAFLVSASHINCVVFSSRLNRYLAVVSVETKSDVDNHDLASQFEHLINDHEWLNQPFDKVHLIIGNHLNTLIPKIVFDKEAIPTYLGFNQEMADNVSATFDQLKNTSAVNVYAIEDKLKETVLQYYPDTDFWHFASIFIETTAINRKNLMDDTVVFLNVRDGFFDLLHFKEGKLNFYNLFRYKTKEDFTYFLLAAFKQLGLNPEDVKLQLSGEISENDRLHEMIYRYIRHSSFVEKNENYGYSTALDKLEHHHYHVLLNLPQCVS
jgi:hypothetical protein